MSHKLFLALLLFSHGIGLSAPALAAGDGKKGEEIYKTQCASCHGAQAEGNKETKAPRLKSQFDWYISKEINEFKSGQRPSPNVQVYKKLSSQDIADVGLYLSQLK